MAINKIVLNTDDGQRTLVDLTDSTVTADKLAKGVTAYDKAGEKITGEHVCPDTVEVCPQVDLYMPENSFANGALIQFSALGDDGKIGFRQVDKNVTTANNITLQSEVVKNTILFAYHPNGSLVTPQISGYVATVARSSYFAILRISGTCSISMV